MFFAALGVKPRKEPWTTTVPTIGAPVDLAPRDRPAEAIADDGDPGYIDHGILT